MSEATSPETKKPRKKNPADARKILKPPPPRPDRFPSGRTLDQFGALCVLELGTLYVTPAGAERIRRTLELSPTLQGQARHTAVYQAAGALSYEAELFALERGSIYDVVVCHDLHEYPYQDRRPEPVPTDERNQAYDRAATGSKRNRRNMWESIPGEEADNEDEPDLPAVVAA